MECHLEGLDADACFKVCLCNSCSSKINFSLKFTHSLFKYKGMLARWPCRREDHFSSDNARSSKRPCSSSHSNPCFLLILTNVDLTGAVILAIVLSLLHQQCKLKKKKKKKKGEVFYSYLLHYSSWGYIIFILSYPNGMYCLHNSAKKSWLTLRFVMIHCISS